MIVTEASQAHATVMAAVHATAFGQGERWDVAAFASLLAQPGVFALMDPDGDFVLARVAADEAEILTLAVAPPLRRQGRGRALLREAARTAYAAGARAMFLEVTERNDAARALYAAAGFTQVGLRRHYYPDGTDALVLRTDLTRGAAADG